jgi:hypothetical protein
MKHLTIAAESVAFAEHVAGASLSAESVGRSVHPASLSAAAEQRQFRPRPRTAPLSAQTAFLANKSLRGDLTLMSAELKRRGTCLHVFCRDADALSCINGIIALLLLFHQPMEILRWLNGCRLFQYMLNASRKE